MNQPDFVKRVIAKKAVSCCDCGLYGLCQIAGLNELDQGKIDQLVHRRKRVANGESLVQSGSPLQYIYAVKSGMFKSVNHYDDGTEQVVDFHLPGELIGLEALHQGSFHHTVVALDNSSVCEMDIQAMERLSDQQIRYQQKLIQALSHKVNLDQYQALLVGAQNADQRVALFLMNIAGRFDQHGMPYQHFRLAMLRRDIANYLGLALETVGRVFKRLETQGLLKTQGRYTQLLDMPALARLAGLQHSLSPSAVA